MNIHSLKSASRAPKSHHSSFSPASYSAQTSLDDLEEQIPDSYLRSLALDKAQQGHYSEAIRLLSRLINRHPNHAIDYNNRGLVYFQSGRFFLAIEDYNRALQINPGLANAYNNRANYYAACGQLAFALTDYNQAIDLNPSYVRAWINRGITLRDLGKYEQAIENFDIAEVLGQLQGHIYAERGRAYHLSGDWNCAVADYRRALKQLPQQHDSPEPTGRLHLQVETWLNQLLSTVQS